MTGMQASLRSGLGVVAFGVFVGLMGACAKGDALDGLDGDGEGGSGGSGRTNGSGPTTKATTGGLSGPSSTTTGTSVTNGSSTTGPTTTNTVASSSSGGPVDCDPENPGPGCGAAQHCVPQASGDPLCEVAGAGTAYQLCPNGRSECAPIYECVFDGFDACCMRWCQVAANDCGGAETCTGFNPPAYIGGVEYGVCWDSYPCVI